MRKPRANTHAPGALVSDTTDALDLFFREDQPLRAPELRRRGGACETNRGGRREGKGEADQLKPSPRRLDREEVPPPRPCSPRSDPGGSARPDAGSGEVRLAPRPQVLNLRYLVDPAGNQARPRQLVEDHPSTGPPRSRGRTGSIWPKWSSPRASIVSRDRRRSPAQSASPSSRSLRCGSRTSCYEPRQADRR